MTARSAGTPKRVAILGTRGIPAQHGGFETLAERLALHLRSRGWEVTVYCQTDGARAPDADDWHGVQRVFVAPGLAGAAGTIAFDLRACLHASARWPLHLVFGYNTAILCALQRMRGRVVLMNMDGIEWRRQKWRWPARTWLRLNERLGCAWANHLIADHPEIRRHLLGHADAARVSTIPYGADAIADADPAPLGRWGLAPQRFVSLVARPEPENSILEMVRAFAARARGMKLAVLGRYDPSRPYHRAVQAAASDEVVFAGAVYDRATLAAIRFHSALYLHGHQVGGTNPSLVEALGAGSPVLAHDNPFNRWVAGPEAAYFASERECAQRLDALLEDPAARAAMRAASRARHAAAFGWEEVLAEYEALLARWAEVAAGRRPASVGEARG